MLYAKELKKASHLKAVKSSISKAALSVISDLQSEMFCLIGVPLTAQLYFLGIRLAVSDIVEVVLAAISTQSRQSNRYRTC